MMPFKTRLLYWELSEGFTPLWLLWRLSLEPASVTTSAKTPKREQESSDDCKEPLVTEPAIRGTYSGVSADRVREIVKQ